MDAESNPHHQVGLVGLELRGEDNLHAHPIFFEPESEGEEGTDSEAESAASGSGRAAVSAGAGTGASGTR